MGFSAGEPRGDQGGHLPGLFTGEFPQVDIPVCTVKALGDEVLYR